MPPQYIISRARIDELDDLVRFIGRHWREDHIFVKSTELLRWQHADGDTLNFILARHVATREVAGVFGFIPISQYDKTLEECRDTWGAIWKVVEDVPPGLGMQIMQFFHDVVRPRSHGSVANTDLAMRIYKLTGQQTGTLQQYYMLSRAADRYRIAQASVSHEPIGRRPDSSVMRECTLSPDVRLSHPHHPRKSITYLINRYQKHPIYIYRFLSVTNGDALTAILVFRKQMHGAAACLRLVDMYGDIAGVGGLYHQFQALLEREGAEYVDCFNYGLGMERFSAMGFELLNPDGDTIVPNYFEPFERRNVRINFALKSPYPAYLIFKGDGDQDRPSTLEATA